MKQNRSPGPKSRLYGDCQLVLLILGAILAELGLFFRFFPYPIGKILMLILGQSLAVNLLLMIPPEGRPLPGPELPQPSPLPGDSTRKERRADRSRRFRRAAKLRCWRAADFLSRHRPVCVTVLGAGIVAALNLWFWRQWRPFFQHPVSVAVPVVFGAGFFLLLGLDIWCGHLNREAEDPEGREACILGNLQNQILFDKFLFLGAAVVSAMPMLGLPKLYRPYYLFLCVWYAVQTILLVVLFGIRLAKGEMGTHPDLRPLVRHRKKGDLSLLTYLEENTGITMRSLWSISLVKTLVPYTLVLAALLLWLGTGIVQIAPNQHGALYRLGKLSRELDPGLHMTLPWPFDAVEVYNTESLQEITIGYTTDQEKGDNLWTENHGGVENKLLLGGGNELVSINLRIEYKISDLTAYLKCSNAPEALLESAAYEAVTARTISTNLESLLALDRFAFSHSFRQELTERISRYETGLEVVDVVLESIHPPVEVAQIYQQIISAGIDAQRILLDAQAAAAVVVEQARTQRDTAVNEAAADSYSEIAQARSSVAEFLAGVDAYAAYGDNYRFYKYLEALQKAYSDATLILVGEGVDSSHLYLGQLPVQ